MLKIMQLLYKICAATDWAGAQAAGAFTGAAIDQADGFIHLSTIYQGRETAVRHFAGGKDLVLVAFARELLCGFQWESTRGGDLFPHVYGVIPVRAARWVRPLPLKGGVHVFPGEIP